MADTVLNPPIFTATSFILISQASDLNDNKIWFHLNNIDATVSTTKVKYQLWGQNSGIPSQDEEANIFADGELYYIDGSNISFSDDTFYNFRISAFVEDDPARKWSDIISIMRASAEDLSWEFPLPTNNYTLSPTEKLNVKVNLNTSSQDQIARFKVEVEDASDNIVYSSGAILNNKSYAQLVVPYNFLNAGTYTINVICITNYGYVLTANQIFTVNDMAGSGTVQLTVEQLSELGVNRLTLGTSDPQDSYLIRLYRAKNDNNYILVKEDYWYTGIAESYIWDDRTIISDESYSYLCIFNIIGEDIIYSISPVSVDPISFEYDYLTDSTAQLTIQYNKDLSGYRYNTNDAITATIGSQYPFIRRAAAAKYRTFTIGGMITFNTEAFYAAIEMQDSISHTDPEHPEYMEHMYEFAKLFHGGNDNIDSTTIVFNKNSTFVQGLLTHKKEVYLERIFRNAVEDFLYSNTVKLFRSATEGNIFVKLTNVQLTPEKQLGRMIYSFSATATEVGAFNEANLKEFDFIDQVGEAVPVHIPDYAIFATAVNDGVAQGVDSSDIIQVVNNEYKVQLQPFARLIFF